MHMSFQEIADTTGVSINTALGRMRYALISLRKRINESNILWNRCVWQANSKSNLEVKNKNLIIKTNTLKSYSYGNSFSILITDFAW